MVTRAKYYGVSPVWVLYAFLLYLGHDCHKYISGWVDPPADSLWGLAVTTVDELVCVGRPHGAGVTLLITVASQGCPSGMTVVEPLGRDSSVDSAWLLLVLGLELLGGSSHVGWSQPPSVPGLGLQGRLQWKPGLAATCVGFEGIWERPKSQMLFLHLLGQSRFLSFV